VKTSNDNSFTLPGTGSGTAQQLLLRSAPARAGDSDQIVWRVSHGSVTNPALEQRMSAMLARVSHLPEVASVTSPYLPGGKVQVSPDGRTAYATVNFTKAADDLEKADINRVVAVATAAREPGLAVELGGKAISNTEQAPLSSASAIGIGAAAVILLIAFGSLLAMALPIVTAVAGVGSGLMLIAPLSHLMSVNGLAPILGALIGLGVGVDYALFIVTRYRRGLQAGLDPERSATQALNTSGRAVLFAGGTVCIALLGLLTIGLGFLDGMAVPAAITVVCTVLAAVTLLPALFGVLGQRVLSRRQRRRRHADGPDLARSGRSVWARWSRTVPRFPAVLAAAAVAVMAVVSVPVLHLRLGASDASNDPTSSHTYKAYEMLAKGFGPGFSGPLLLVARTGSAADRAALGRLDRALTAVPGVAAVQAGPAQTRPSAGPAVEVTQVIPTTAPESQATSSLITHLRDTVIPRYTHGTTLRVYVGGLTATFDDLAAVTSAKLPWLLAAIVGFGFLLLVLAFRSLLIPATTAVLNLLSAAATFGVLTAFFEWGWGTSAFGLGRAGPIEAYMPELVLAILFGLSMDYQVFLVSRIAEEWSSTRDNTRAVLAGQTETGRVITAAATIMIAVFIAFAFTGQRSVAEFGIGLAAAVALDAFVLRTVLVPAVMHLCGRANWWLPGRLDRRLPRLAVEPSGEQPPAQLAEPTHV
jgi:RND superfamily putative drug exporter